MQNLTLENQMTLVDKVALKIAGKVTGIEASKADFLADGATSQAWKVAYETGDIVVRTIRPDAGRPVTYQSEYEVCKQLKLEQVPVPETLATYKELDIDGVSIPWSVTKLMPGNAIKSEKLTASVAKDIGRALTKIHCLSVNGFGRLDEHKIGVNGKQGSPLQGILARWCFGNLWPFDQTLLSGNVGYKFFENLESRILKYEDAIKPLACDENVVLVHSDLHGEHIFVEDDRLSGLIDFGSAFIGIAEWEFGRLGCQFGWPGVILILDAYDSESKREVLSRRSFLMGLVICLYKIHRYANEGAPKYKIEKSLEFLTSTLDLLDDCYS